MKKKFPFTLCSMRYALCGLLLCAMLFALCVNLLAGTTTNFGWNYGIKGQSPWWEIWTGVFQNIDTELYGIKLKTNAWVDVRSFGAKGDGVTDDYAAFQLAVDSGAKCIIIPYTASGYVINHRVVITTNYVNFVGIGKPVIKTTLTTAPAGSEHQCQFYFFGLDPEEGARGYLIGCGVYGIVFNNSSFLGNAPEAGAAWLANIRAQHQKEFTVKDCHWIDAVSAGIGINSGERIIIDSCTAKGVHSYGWDTANALEGNFIQLYGMMEYTPSYTSRHWRGGNIVTNCRFDARSDTDFKTLLGAANYLYNWDDYGTSRSGKWHENNCSTLISPFGLGADEPNSPFITFTNNHVRNFDVGVYSEPAGTMHAGTVIIENNTFYQNNTGMTVWYEGNTIVNGNMIYKCSNNAIQAIPDSMIITNNLIIDFTLQGADFSWAIDCRNVGNAAQPVACQNVVISNNVIRQSTVNAANNNRFLGITVGLNYNDSTATVKDISIIGNSIYLKGSSSGADPNLGAIDVQGNVQNVVIQGNTIRESPSSAIWLRQSGSVFGSPMHVNISGNVIDTVYSGVIIRLGDETNDVLVTGNIIKSSRLIGNFVYDGTTGVTARRLIHNNLIGANIYSTGDGFWTAAPTTGTWQANDIVWNATPSASNPPGWICITSGTFSTATDNTGDTDGATGTITGMTDTSDFAPGQYVSLSAGFATTGPYRILSKTATSITIDVDSNSAQSNITVSTPDPVFKAMANLAS